MIFYSQYSSNEEKRNLIDKCHEQGGSPVIDTRDSARLEGSTDSISAKREGVPVRMSKILKAARACRAKLQ